MWLKYKWNLLHTRRVFLGYIYYSDEFMYLDVIFRKNLNCLLGA